MSALGQVQALTGPGIRRRLLQQWADETFDGITARVTLNSIWNRDFTPIPPGTHAILAPDRSHGNISTAGYVSAAPGMHGNDVWFPIGLNGAATPSGRYIHVGHLSEGCITQHDLTQWSAIYDYLISSREPGSLPKTCRKSCCEEMKFSVRRSAAMIAAFFAGICFLPAADAACADFLAKLKKRPAHLQYLSCKHHAGSEGDSWIAEYRSPFGLAQNPLLPRHRSILST